MTRHTIDLRKLVVLGVVLCACGGSTPAGSVTPALPELTPTVDPVTQAYVALAHQYWVDLVAADGNAGTVCYAGPINAAQCKVRAEAQLAVQQTFLSDLQATTVPAQFAEPNAVLVANLPTAIADLNAMIAASASGDRNAIVQAAGTYVDLMRGTIEGTLDQIDPAVNHQR